jgi:hypothetical protein
VVRCARGRRRKDLLSFGALQLEITRAPTPTRTAPRTRRRSQGRCGYFIEHTDCAKALQYTFALRSWNCEADVIPLGHERSVTTLAVDFVPVCGCCPRVERNVEQPAGGCPGIHVDSRQTRGLACFATGHCSLGSISRSCTPEAPPGGAHCLLAGEHRVISIIFSIQGPASSRTNLFSDSATTTSRIVTTTARQIAIQQ